MPEGLEQRERHLLYETSTGTLFLSALQCWVPKGKIVLPVRLHVNIADPFLFFSLMVQEGRGNEGH